MDAATIATIIGAGGLGVLVPQIFNGLRGHLDGRHQREKAEAVDALTQRDTAVRERNAADRRARIYAEHASRLRRLLIERSDLTEADIPPWPAEERPDKE